MRTRILAVCLLAVLPSVVAAGDILIPVAPTSSPSCNGFPFSTSNGEWRYQFVIGANHLGGKARVLNHISFRPCQSNTFKAATFEMSMSHITLKTAPSMTFAANMPSPQVVIPAGPITYVRTSSTWSTIKLTRTFTYNGNDSLTIELRYKGGSLTGGSTSGSDDSTPRNTTYQCYRVLKSGSGAYAATTATSQFSTGMLLTKLTYVDASISGSGSPSIGGTVNLNLLSPADAGLPYQVGTSLGLGPVPIGTRKLGLSLDGLLQVSILGYLPAIFQKYAGNLASPSGTAVAAVVIPKNAGLIGVRLHSAFVTIKPGAPQNLKSISNTYSFTIAK